VNSLLEYEDVKKKGNKIRGILQLRKTAQSFVLSTSEDYLLMRIDQRIAERKNKLFEPQLLSSKRSILDIIS